MNLNWSGNDYFSLLLHRDKRAHSALEMLVDDLHTDKERTISRFLCHSGSEDFLWGLVRLLGDGISRVAGNAAYILGTIAESELGCYRVISLTTSRQAESQRILPDLTQMLAFDDSESVMNAAGTMGTLAESHDGRAWMLGEKCLPLTITHITRLLANDNLWTASNAALVLARLTISEEGCEQILTHPESDHILSQLINSLGVDEAGRGMNAAFAIGRMCDMEQGRSHLLSLTESEKMITSLAWMLCCSDAGASKNACFALSCLATNKDGHTRLLKNGHSEEVLRTLSDLLSSEDSETGWFAAMTLRTLASQPKGCLRLREHASVLPALKSASSREDVVGDLRDEVEQTLDILKRLEKPSPPLVEVNGTEANITWEEVTTKCGFTVKYQIFEGGRCVHTGHECTFVMGPLQPFTEYSFRLRVYTEGDESPLSEPVTVTTEEAVPDPPINLMLLGSTTTQLKVGWEMPEKCNGLLKGFYVYNGKVQVEFTSEMCSIISGLQPNTAYEIHVCAANAKGKGAKETISAVTTELGAHAPSKPEVIVRGRNELYVMWKPPEMPLGRITRYDLVMDGNTIHSGTELHYSVHRLKPDREYSFVVTAITSEGRCESKITKKRTAKDEYEGDRAPLYQTPNKKDANNDPESKSDGIRPSAASLSKKRKSIGALSNVSHDSSPPKSAGGSRTPSASATSKGRHKDTKPSTNTEAHQSETTSLSSRKSSIDTGTTRRDSSDKSLKRRGSDSRLHYDAEPPLLEKSRSSLSSAKSRSSRVSDKADSDMNASRSGQHSSRSRSRTNEQLYRAQQLHAAVPKRRLSRSMDLEAEKSLSQKSTVSVNNTFSSTERLQIEPTNKVDTVEIQEGKMPSIQTSAELLSPRHNRKSHARNSPMRAHHKNNSAPMNSAKDDNELEGCDHQVASPESEPESSERRMSADSDLASQIMFRRQEPMEFNRSYTTLQSGHYKPANSHVRSNMIDMDAPLSLGARPAPVHRANTFISSHRPGMKRHLNKLASPKFNFNQTLPNQWQPDFPLQSANERQHNKFVPSQFRTQPAHIPGGIQRQITNLSLMEGSHPNLRLDLMSRGRNSDPDLAAKVMSPPLLQGPGHQPTAPSKYVLSRNQTLRERLQSAETLETAPVEPSTKITRGRRHRSSGSIHMGLFNSHPPSENHKLQSAS